MKYLLRAFAIALLSLAAAQPALSVPGRSGGFTRSIDDDVAALKVGQVRTGGVQFPSEPECTVEAGGAANVNLDCDGILPNNEPDIEVNPANPSHMIASSNDYESCCDQYYTSFDDGETWQTGDMSAMENAIGSDPVTVFDTRTGTAIHSSLNFFFDEERGETFDGHLVVSLSTDGGVNWDEPIIVARGEGHDTDPFQLFHDKEWIVTDNYGSSPFYGRTYITWSAFHFEFGEYQSSPIWEAHSDDGGRTWSEPQEISGASEALCTFQENDETGPFACDQNQFSVPTVAPDGTVYVAFENEQNEALWEPGEQFDDQYLVVKSTNGGETWSDPIQVIGLEDGSRDYPRNVFGRQTLTGMQVRVNSAGNIVADPRTGQLYLVFADNRAGVHDSDKPKTDTNVYLMTSPDGATWSGPFPVDKTPSDQWFPWVEVNPTSGELGIVFHDRIYLDYASRYNTKLVTGFPGSFTKTTLTTRTSHPNQSVFFQARAPGCIHCATFHGDYNNLSYGSDGQAHITWTDMRDRFERERFPDLFLQFIYYAKTAVDDE